VVLFCGVFGDVLLGCGTVFRVVTGPDGSIADESSGSYEVTYCSSRGVRCLGCLVRGLGSAMKSDRHKCNVVD
jgi:hypothetical protein